MRKAMQFAATLLATAFLAGALTAPAPAAARAFHTVSWSPPRLVNGSPCLFRVEIAGDAASVTGRWQGRDLEFVASTDRRVWYSLAGVDVDTKPGTYKLELNAELPGGARIHQQKAISVSRAKVAREKLRVPERFVEPDTDTLVRIEHDHQLKQAAFSHQTETTEWSGAFVPPIDSRVSENFGTRRTFNGRLASIHRGLDYRAVPGTPVTAANSGVVVLAQELFYEGDCVIIDHGQQFTTMYMHLSKLEVGEGQRIEKGQEIGLSGASGRATGPHLHVAVRWQGAYLDPAQLWTLRLPNLHAPALAPVSAK